MKSYSPTATKTFQECPTKWVLSRKVGYATGSVYKNTLAGVTGSTFGLAASHFYQHNRGLDADVLTQYALEHYDSEIEALRDQGRTIVAVEEVGKYRGHLANIIPYYVHNDPIPHDWSVEHIEHNVGMGHEARIDLGVRTAQGELCVVDFKMKMWLQKKDIPFRLAEYKDDWQFLHYSHFYGQQQGAYVPRYYIILVSASPSRSITVQPFSVSPHKLEWWYDSARYWWGQMEEVERACVSDHEAQKKLIAMPPMAPNHYTRWGRCEFFDGCMSHRLDPSGMSTQYVQIERRGV